MPAYNNSPFVSTYMLEQGTPSYSFGSFNGKVPDTRMLISNTALTSNVATYTFTVVEGNIPVAGQLVTVVGSQQNSAYNVVNAVIASVPTSSTFTVAVTHANIATGADNSAAIAKVPEVAEALAVGAGQVFAVPTTQPGNSGRQISWQYYTPSAPSSLAIQLEGAINNVATEFVKLDNGTVFTTAGETRCVTVANAIRFLRLNVTATTGGTSPTLVGKIEI